METQKTISVTIPQVIVPTSLITQELEGVYGSSVLADMQRIIELYGIYEKGAKFETDANNDYIPSNLPFKISRMLVDKEARFLFGKVPDIKVDATGGSEEQNAKNSTVMQNYLSNVLKKNGFSKKLLQAAKDCFIGKRVACILNFDNEDGNINIRFAPSLEFVYDVDPVNPEILTKIVAFYMIKDNKAKADQEIYKKKYWMENGYCRVQEAIYDGLGNLKETIIDDMQTAFEYIPAFVIVNDSLTGDMLGESDIGQLAEYESYYSRLSNADIDAERKGMNPVKVIIDANPQTTKNLSQAAGSMWDIQSDANGVEGTKATAEILESSMPFSNPLETTLKRIKSSMYEQVDVPDILTVQSKLSSGKELKAIYWSLIVRCDEKMITWRTALEFVVKCLVDGAKLYDKARAAYSADKLPETQYNITVENQYPLPEDEAEEKQTDMAQVTAQVMSRKSYMLKWMNYTDKEADEELNQISLEKQLLEDSYLNPQM